MCLKREKKIVNISKSEQKRKLNSLLVAYFPEHSLVSSIHARILVIPPPIYTPPGFYGVSPKIPLRCRDSAFTPLSLSLLRRPSPTLGEA